MASNPCDGCSEIPSYSSKKCAECGYKFAMQPDELEIEIALTRIRADRIYKLLRLSGVGLSFAAVVAEFVDQSGAAVYLLALGAAIFVIGTVSVWWNAE